MLDLLVKGANVAGYSGSMDVAVSGGRITQVSSVVDAEAAVVVQAKGGFLASSFVDSHMHIDKALVQSSDGSENLKDAIEESNRYFQSVRGRAASDIEKRASKLLRWAATAGTCAVKTHITINEYYGMAGFDVLWDMKRKFRGVIDVYNITPWYNEFDAQWHAAAKKGMIDFVGGYPGLLGGDDYAAEVDQIFALALKYGLPVDLHVNESDAPDIRCFEYVLKKPIQTGMQGRVSCSHVPGLNAVDDETAARVLDLAAQAQVNIITLPSCNLYLMGRADKEPVRRGLTRVREFQKRGVNVAFASDNVRDHFRPFGNADMLQESLLSAQVLQYGTKKLMNLIYDMGTICPAKNALLRDYGVQPGCRADFVLYDEKSAPEAIVAQKSRRLVVKDGRIIAKRGKLIKGIG